MRARASGYKMADSPQSPPGPSVRPLTARKVFAWTFDFEFLMEKANHELELSMSYPNFFFPNAMNFSVTIHAIADHLWHLEAIRDPQWENTQSKFVEWIKTKSDCISLFIDISNTYKHSDRNRKIFCRSSWTKALPRRLGGFASTRRTQKPPRW